MGGNLDLGVWGWETSEGKSEKINTDHSRSQKRWEDPGQPRWPSWREPRQRGGPALSGRPAPRSERSRGPPVRCAPPLPQDSAEGITVPRPPMPSQGQELRQVAPGGISFRELFFFFFFILKRNRILSGCKNIYHWPRT